MNQVTFKSFAKEHILLIIAYFLFLLDAVLSRYSNFVLAHLNWLLPLPPGGYDNFIILFYGSIFVMLPIYCILRNHKTLRNAMRLALCLFMAVACAKNAYRDFVGYTRRKNIENTRFEISATSLSQIEEWEEGWKQKLVLISNSQSDGGKEIYSRAEKLCEKYPVAINYYDTSRESEREELEAALKKIRGRHPPRNFDNRLGGILLDTQFPRHGKYPRNPYQNPH